VATTRYRTVDRLPDRRQPGSPTFVAAGLGHACIGRLAARRAIDPSLTWLAPRERLSTRQIAFCYPRHRQITGAVSALISTIQVHSTG
jgi:DNA-binding transcriptional LysR family regulator